MNICMAASMGIPTRLPTLIREHRNGAYSVPAIYVSKAHTVTIRMDAILLGTTVQKPWDDVPSVNTNKQMASHGFKVLQDFIHPQYVSFLVDLGPGLPGDSTNYQGHLLSQKGHLCDPMRGTAIHVSPLVVLVCPDLF